MKEIILRVVAQLTISPRIISLVAEEDLHPYKKGQVVKRITRAAFNNAKKPLTVKVTAGGGKVDYARLIIQNPTI